MINKIDKDWDLLEYDIDKQTLLNKINELVNIVNEQQERIEKLAEFHNKVFFAEKHI